MKLYQQRVVAECDELKTKLDALNRFIDGEVFKGLESTEQHLLEEQYRFMFRYYDILVKRIANFKD